MVYKIFKKNNYIVVVDDRNFYYEEHCSAVLVLKRLSTDSTYDIVFVRPDNVPQAFYNVPFADIRDEFNASYASVAAWETWYTTNTGCQGGANTAATLASILATLQAQSEVEGVFVKDTSNDKVVLQVRVWDQDSQTFINTLYFNPDGTPYTPVGPLEWVGTSGSTNSIITGPLGNTTNCTNSVAVTFCDALYQEFFDQGLDLSNIYDILSTSLVATVNQGSSPWITSLDAATITALQNVSSTITGPLGVQVSDCNSGIAVTICDLQISQLVQQTTFQSFVEDFISYTQSFESFSNQTDNQLDSIISTINDIYAELATGTLDVNINSSVALDVNQSGSWTVALDTATLDALETTTVNQGTSPWVVSASALDIRNLDCLLDSVAICDGSNTLVMNQDGSINTVTTITGTLPLPTDAATETTLLDVKNLLTDIKNNVTSKIERIKGAGDYERIITYADPANGDFRITKIVHKGTTLLVVPPLQEIVTETLTYYNLTDNVTNILYS